MPTSTATVSLPVPQSMLSTSPSSARIVSSSAPPETSSTSPARLSLASIRSSPGPPRTLLLPAPPSRSPSMVDPLPSSPGPPLTVSSPLPPFTLSSSPGPPSSNSSRALEPSQRATGLMVQSMVSAQATPMPSVTSSTLATAAALKTLPRILARMCRTSLRSSTTNLCALTGSHPSWASLIALKSDVILDGGGGHRQKH